MLVECSKCGAPLDVKQGARVARCTYCGSSNQVRSTRTLAMQTPAGWTPPQVWTPPAHVSIDSQPLKYGAAAAATGFSCLPGVITAIVLAITGGAVFFATAGSLPFFGKVDRWDGASTLRCDMNEHLVLDGHTATVSGPVIDASGLNCHVTIRSCRLNGTVVVQGGTNTEVVVEDSVLEASDRAIVGALNMKVRVRGQSTVSGAIAAIDGAQNLHVEVDGPARLLSQGDGIRGSQNAEVWLRGASIEAGGVAISAGLNPKVHANQATITGGQASLVLSQNARVELVGSTVNGVRQLGRNARLDER